jgi:rare lipoprotein A
MYRHPQDLCAAALPRDPRAKRGFPPAAALPSLLPLLAAALLAGACTGHRTPTTSPSQSLYFQEGMASWYGPTFHGRRTANGERYDMHELTVAHPSLPFGTRLAVTNLDNGKQVVVRVNDRGPFKKQRIIDLSYAAASTLGVVGPGTARVGLTLLEGIALPAEPAPLRYTVQVAAFSEPERAAALRTDLLPVYPETVVEADGTWNRVRVGVFENRDQADALRRELAAMGMDSVVVEAR